MLDPDRSGASLEQATAALPPFRNGVPDPRPVPTTPYAHLLREVLDVLFAAYPIFATEVGYHAFDDRWPDLGEAARIGTLADVGRLLGEAVAAAEHLTRAGIADGLQRVKQLPATSGYEGTQIGFGVWDHAALKGHYLVLRAWKDGRSVQV